jgi:hypothetical protein
VDDSKLKSALARLRDCLKGGQFDISKGCRPQRVDKHVISVESPDKLDEKFSNPISSRITSEKLDCLTDDLLLL